MSDQNFNIRIQKLQEAMKSVELNALVVTPGPNLSYLTGLHFHTSERPTVLLISEHGEAFWIVPALEESKAAKSSFKCQIFTYTDEEGPRAAFDKLAESANLSSVQLGVEGRRIRFLELNLIQAAAIKNADNCFAELRMCKTSTEIEAMQKATDIAQTALENCLKNVVIGMEERELAAELVLQCLRAGSLPELPFMPIVACGKNGALPHAEAAANKLKSGDLITIDWGANCNGYFSDLTRTFAIGDGEVDSQLMAAYESVRAGNEKARRLAAPGKTAEEVDRAARSVIEEAGFAQYFTHRTGHGLGLECHEEPDIKTGNPQILKEGMTFTIEPGVYIPNLGGIRIEDDMVITSDGARSLSTLPRDLQRIAL